jgi:hypothetical protein
MHPPPAIRSLIIVLAAFGAIAGATSTNGETRETIRFRVVSPVDVRVAGTSSLHDWECVGDRLDLSAELNLTEEQFERVVEASWAGAVSFPIDFEEKDETGGSPLRVEVPIEALECDRSRMQRDLRRTIRFDEYPIIKYQLKSVSDGAASGNGDSALSLTVTGDLRIAGITREVEHEVEIRQIAGNRFEIRGELALKMNWFDMEPPTALFGLLRAHDDFRVNFHFETEIDRD